MTAATFPVEEESGGEQPCPICAGTGKVAIQGPLPTGYAAATNVIFDLEMIKDLKVICGT